MSEARERWDEAGERFGSLGRRLKERYEQEREAEAGPAGRDAGDALRRLGDALDEVFTSMGAVVRDPEVKEELREAGRSLGTAIAATFEDVGREVRRAGDDLRRRFGNRSPDA